MSNASKNKLKFLQNVSEKQKNDEKRLQENAIKPKTERRLTEKRLKFALVSN